jgi:hypothetical protein
MTRIQRITAFASRIKSKARLPFQILFSLIFVFYIAAATFDATPKRGDLSKKIHTFTHHCLLSLRVIQSWKMFISSPTIHKLDIALILTDHNDIMKELDPILPGFSPMGAHFKEELFFLRTYKAKKYYLNKYLERACIQAKEKFNTDFKTARIKYTRYETKTMTSLLKSKDFTDTLVSESEEVKCPA